MSKPKPAVSIRPATLSAIACSHAVARDERHRRRRRPATRARARPRVRSERQAGRRPLSLRTLLLALRQAQALIPPPSPPLRPHAGRLIALSMAGALVILATSATNAQRTRIRRRRAARTRRSPKRRPRNETRCIPTFTPAIAQTRAADHRPAAATPRKQARRRRHEPHRVAGVQGLRRGSHSPCRQEVVVTARTVTELPRALEPVSSDTFLDDLRASGRAMSQGASGASRPECGTWPANSRPACTATEPTNCSDDQGGHAIPQLAGTCLDAAPYFVGELTGAPFSPGAADIWGVLPVTRRSAAAPASHLPSTSNSTRLQSIDTRRTAARTPSHPSTNSKITEVSR
jgi:hypothetical protein